jgi:hypothetical protein
VYVKDNLNCNHREYLENNDIDGVWLECKPTISKPFLKCLLYIHHESRVDWKEKFEIHLEKAQFVEKEILIVGDMNRDLLHSQFKNDWTKFMIGLRFTQIIDKPTRKGRNFKTLIDHIYTDNSDNICNCCVPKVVISDHYPIFCNRNANYRNPSKSHQFIQYRSFF